MLENRFRADIQGLRGLAVAAVVLFHAWPKALPGGFVGVDIFFAISGFLIGGHLQRDSLTGQLSLLTFYHKRARRLLPALLVMLAATLGLGGILLSPDNYQELARTALSSALFASNIDFYLFSGYFDQQAELRPLLHTWSLSVEEQFYLLFPFLLFMVIKWRPSALVPLTLLGIMGGVILSEWGLRHSPTGAYFLLPFRGFEFLIGALAAYLPAPRKDRPILRPLALATLGLCMVWLTPDMPFPGLRAGVPSFATAVLLWVGRFPLPRQTGGMLAGGMLGAGFLGRISYSLYLWHWPLMAFLRSLAGEVPDALMALCVGVSVILAWLSWRYIEKPFARLPTGHSPILRWSAAGLALIMLPAWGIWHGQGIPQRFAPQVLALYDAAQDISPWRESCHQDDRDRKPYARTCRLGGSGAPPLVVWGDSHGAELAAALARNQPLRQITASACPPVLGPDLPRRPQCARANQRMLTAISGDPAVETVLLAMNREAYPELPAQVLQDGLRETVTRLRQAGKRVILLGQIPNPHRDPAQSAGNALRFGRLAATAIPDPEAHSARLRAWAEIEQQLVTADRIIRIDPRKRLCAGGECPFVMGGKVLYFNDTHPSMAGARRLAEQIRAEAADILPQPRTPTPPRMSHRVNSANRVAIRGEFNF
ncbi:acyltransferase family protein [Thioclava sp. GXIMD4216]|uniref:acyltransferase family protein n=1 Tax=Thioclava sp. GXIMD4216 TaxID=3131929 RepID=UPI0030CBF40A